MEEEKQLIGIFLRFILCGVGHFMGQRGVIWVTTWGLRRTLFCFRSNLSQSDCPILPHENLFVTKIGVENDKHYLK